MKRQRGRGRKPGNNNNRTFESNGPDVKVRGSASHIYDKYMQLARDATSSGDRVMAEAYYQHAEHYLRIVQANQANQPKPREDQGQPGGGEDSRSGEGGDEGRNAQREGGDGDSENHGGRNRNRRGRGRRRDEDSVETPQGATSDSGSTGESSDPLQVVELDGADGNASASTAEESPQPEAAPKRTRTRRRKTENSADADAEKALKATDGGSDDQASDDAAA